MCTELKKLMSARVVLQKASNEYKKKFKSPLCIYDNPPKRALIESTLLGLQGCINLWVEQNNKP